MKTRHLAISLMLLMSALMAPVARASSSGPAVGLDVGVTMHAMWDYDSDAERLAVLDKLVASGVGWVRIDLSWCSLQEDSRNEFSSWYVKRAEQMIDAARARGLEVLSVVSCTPAWATDRPDAPWYEATSVPPSDPADFGRVMGWLAKRFAGRVAAWEVWNEPNQKNFFNQNAEDYVAILKQAYPAIKDADPTATVVMGGTSYSDDRWLRWVYESGAAGYFDVVAVHPYMAPANLPPEARLDTIWTVTAVERIRSLMVERGDADVPIWFTEFGWSAHANSAETRPYALGVSPEQQADFLVRTIEHVRANYPWVAKIFWYNATNRDTDNVHEANFGLLTRDLIEKPAYQALKKYLTEPKAQPANLLENGDFEQGVGGWSVVGGTAAPSSGVFGSSGVTVTRRSGRAVVISSSRVSAGLHSYVASGHLRLDEPGSVRVSVVESVDGERTGATTRIVALEGGSWQTLPPITHLSSDEDAELAIKLRAGRAGPPTITMDDFRLTAN